MVLALSSVHEGACFLVAVWLYFGGSSTSDHISTAWDDMSDHDENVIFHSVPGAHHLVVRVSLTSDSA